MAESLGWRNQLGEQDPIRLQRIRLWNGWIGAYQVIVSEKTSLINPCFEDNECYKGMKPYYRPRPPLLIGDFWTGLLLLRPHVVLI